MTGVVGDVLGVWLVTTLASSGLFTVVVLGQAAAGRARRAARRRRRRTDVARAGVGAVGTPPVR